MNPIRKKYTYFFGDSNAEGGKNLKKILGNKGAGLAEMSKIKIPVPPGFTISSEICIKFFQNAYKLPEFFKEHLLKDISKLETIMGLKFGDKNMPLLVSVRSGAKSSMPGMMETILNLGLNRDTVEGLARITKNQRFAYDSYRRYIEMYSNVVLGLRQLDFKAIFNTKKTLLGIDKDQYLSAVELKEIIQEYLKLVYKLSGQHFPQDINHQLWESISAVFKSWNTKRAVAYRKLNNIPSDIGTAVSIQSMVFGNQGNDCASGVSFSRNPSSGKKEIFGEYILNAQGEDIVSGIKTPSPINISLKTQCAQSQISLEEVMPKTYNELKDILNKLELHYKDMQDVEFTVEKGKCWILQTRSGKRTPNAAIRIAVDMLREGIINERQIFKNLDVKIIEKLLHSNIDPQEKKIALTKGLPASPGVASGKIVFSSAQAEKLAKLTKVILVRNETNPEDIIGMNASDGILTSRGGMTSHAAVIARGMGKPCVTGAFQLTIDNDRKIIRINDHVLKENDIITINGSNGEIFYGQVRIVQPQINQYLKDLISISTSYSQLKVLANAETIKDAMVAKNFSAEGIGLCRTEHMFFQKCRIDLFRQMILSTNYSERDILLRKLLVYQQKDFFQLFRIMDGLPVTIRLLDPPFHEFLPQNNKKELSYLSNIMSLSCQDIENRINTLKEINPMLGHRGCRLAITYPEIYQMQIKAIFQATYQCMQNNIATIPEIMVPLVTNQVEFIQIKNLITNIVIELEAQLKIKFQYKIGSMIELPSAIIHSKEIAKEADFISFGTNDLTQTCLGISRDDASKFLNTYIDNGIFQNDPFQTINKDTVGELIVMAIKKIREVNNKIQIGVCGEHAGDSESIKFFHDIKVNYISCSPFRIPVAKIAAAQYSCTTM